MDIEKLRHFVAAADSRSMILGAAECGISQSGLSRSISQLEETLGHRLFIRASRGLELSNTGRALRTRARLIINEFDRSVAELKGPRSVVLGITENFSHYVAPQVVSLFEASKPDVQLVVKTAGALDLIQDLHDATVHLALATIGPMHKDPDLRVRQLQEHHLRVVGRTGHPLAKGGRPVTIDQLSAARWAIHTHQAFQVDFCQSFIAAKAPAPTQVIRSDSLALIRAVVLRDDLLAILPFDFVKADLESGSLVVLNCDTPGEATTSALITRRGGLTTQPQAFLERIIRSCFETPRPSQAALAHRSIGSNPAFRPSDRLGYAQPSRPAATVVNDHQDGRDDRLAHVGASSW